MHTDWLVGGVLIVLGGLLAGGSAWSPAWMFQMPKARALEAAVGRTVTRALYFLAGSIMVLVGLATIVGWMPKASRRTSKSGAFLAPETLGAPEPA